MPGKRKREDDDESRRPKPGGSSRQVVEAKVHHGKQLLSRALKVAKGFERQKLSRRQKTAQKEKKEADVQRINAEIEALRLLDLHAASEIHVHKAILKEKALRDSPLLPTYVPERAKVNLNNATANVTARLWASAPVIKAMVELMAPIRIAMGQAASGANKKTQNTDSQREVVNESGKQDFESEIMHIDRDIGEGGDTSDEDEDEFQGFDTDVVGSTDEGDDNDNISDADSEIGEDSDFTAFDDRVGGSSDDESIDLEAAKANAANRRTAAQDYSLSPSPTPEHHPTGDKASLSVSEDSQEDFDQIEVHSVDEGSPMPSMSDSETDQRLTSTSTAKSPPSKTVLSSKSDPLFLPSLTTGYISGSDSEASDIDDAPARKNRRGQRARQKIWEAKYGAKAKHVEADGSKNGGRDQGWDMKRGAREAGQDRFGRGRGGRGGARGGGGSRKFTTGANMEMVVPRKGPAGGLQGQNRAQRRAGLKKSEAVGKLHPSWEAARKAKEAKAASIGFAGTKVTFD